MGVDNAEIHANPVIRPSDRRYPARSRRLRLFSGGYVSLMQTQ